MLGIFIYFDEKNSTCINCATNIFGFTIILSVFCAHVLFSVPTTGLAGSRKFFGG